MESTRYRWVVLGVGTAAQATVAASLFSVAVLAPQLRAHFDLTIAQTGIVLAAIGIGMTPTPLPWGLPPDPGGGAAGAPPRAAPAGAAVARTRSCAPLTLPLVAAGAPSASVNAASGRAVMQWFAPSQRGLAL